MPHRSPQNVRRLAAAMLAAEDRSVPVEGLSARAETILSSGDIPARLMESAGLHARLGAWVLVPSDAAYPAGPGRIEESLRGRWLFCQGPAELLARQSVCFLNSRQPRGGRGGTEWLRATRMLAQAAASEKLVVVASLGQDSHEAAALAACEADAAMILALADLVPALMEADLRAKYLEKHRALFHPTHTLWISWRWPGEIKVSKETAMIARDALLAGIASRAVAVCLRPGGTMERLALARLRGGLPVDAAASGETVGKGREALVAAGARLVPIELPSTPAKQAELVRAGPAAAEGKLPAEVRRGSWSCLTHYTRACAEPWPGQTRAEYLRELAETGRPRSGMDTLLRIMGERRVRACGKLIRDGVKVVSFTELSPWEITDLACWRSHLVRWSFEPYAVCVLRSHAEPLGIAPAAYLPAARYDDLPPGRRFLYQKHEPPACDWTAEKEWRLRGDLDLAALPNDALFALTATEREAQQIREAFGLRAASFEGLGIEWPGRRTNRESN